MTTGSMLPLTGVTVVAMEHAVAAPMATRHLADLGARVIKIERDGGDFARHYDRAVNGMAAHFVWLNRGKESVVLDLKDPAGASAMRALLAKADVLVQNLSPGAAARLGLDGAVLRAERPELIVCEITGYGNDGPYAHKRAYDALIQAESGVAAVTGPAGEPSKAGIPVADIAAGMYAFSGILAALYARQETGTGALISISMFEALAEWMGYSLQHTRYSGAEPTGTGVSHPSIVPYGAFPTRDGATVLISVQNDREWQRLAHEVLRRPELADDPAYATNQARVAHRAEVDSAVADALLTLDVDDAVRRLDSAGIANARLNRVSEVLSHPQLIARERWTDTATPVGPVRTLLPPINIDGAHPQLGSVPALGADTDAVLAELGLTREGNRL